MSVRRFLSELIFNADAQSSALDLCPEKATLRAGMEGYERCAASFRGDEFYLTRSRQELDGQTRSGSDLIIRPHEPDSFEPVLNETVADWTPVWSLTDAVFLWVLMSDCYLGFPRDRRYGEAHSRGLAAGPTLEFCILKGLYELIETLAVTCSETQRLARPGVDLDDFRESDIKDLRAFHEARGRQLWVLDQTLPNLPAFVFTALSYDPVDGSIVQGSGAHCQASNGIRGALLECTQMLPNLKLDDKQRPSAPGISYHLQDHHRPSQLYGKSHYDEQSLMEYTLQNLIDRLAETGIEVLVKDLTRESIPIRVARVIFSTRRSSGCHAERSEPPRTESKPPPPEVKHDLS